MRFLTLFILSVFGPLMLTAQSENFDLLRTEVPYVFYQASVDSAGQQSSNIGILLTYSDTDFPLFRLGQELDIVAENAPGESCHTTSPTFLGLVMEFVDGGAHLYQNDDPQHPPMYINTAAGVGTSWTAYQAPFSEYTVRMEVISQQTESFLGITDEVKTIKIQHRSSDDDPFMDLIPRLKISENHGLIQGVDLWNLMENEEIIPLVGLNDLGERDYPIMPFFELQTGDKLHVREVEFINNSNGGYYQVTEDIQKVLTMDCDPILGATVLGLSVKRLRYFYQQPGPNAQYIDSTYLSLPNESVVYNWYEGLNWLNGKVGQFASPNTTDNVADVSGGIIQLSTLPSGVIVKSLSADYLQSTTEDCYTTALDLPAGDTYYVGYAGPYYYRAGILSLSVRELVYGNSLVGEVGTPFEWENSFSPSSTLNPEQLSANLSVMPNPASGMVRMTTTELFPDASVTIVDINGRSLFSQAFEDTHVRLELGALPKGVYQVLLQSGGRLVGRKRLVLR